MKHKKILIDGKFIPQRTCVVCKTVQNKSNLIRICKLSDKTVLLDKEQKKGGRGVYCCNNTECITKANKHTLFQKNLRCYISDDLYKECFEYVENT